jgi:serine/threonine protein kinase/tetratricopeptide (TPR) repeat protein
MHAPLGSGAMGVVWRARHVAEGVDVAVKVLAERYVELPLFRQAFRREAQAVARLDHPGVVVVHDFGEVDERCAAASGGTLALGSPYLVMELISGGALHRLRRRVQWADLRELLATLLDALAHAHARGVIHRDLKPANILLELREDGGVLPLLTDFGIAHAEEEGLQALRTDEEEHPHGTPEYMAPEQLQGRWRDQGPWTDLYALGCVVWELICHKRPFDAPRQLSPPQRMLWLREAHLTAPIPPLAPRIEVPEALGRWVTRLLQKAPAERFQSAAEAAWALHLLERRALRSLSTISLPQVSLAPSPPPPPAALWDDDTDSTRFDRPEEAVVAAPWPLELPPLPGSWRKVEASAPQHLPGVGLGLYGLRSPPLVGREKERDILWNTLAEVRRTRRAQALLLRGPAGIGKSALAQWLIERAQEVGAAEGLWTAHAPMSSPAHGLPRLLAGWLRSAGLPGPRVLARAREVLGRLGLGEEEATVRALAEIAAASVQDEPTRGARVVRVRTNAERYHALHQLALYAAQRRPLVIWLDDVQWGLDALGFVQHALRSPQQAPLLFLMTARDDALAERLPEWSALTALSQLPQTTRLDLEPLPPADQRALLQHHLRLEPSLAARVETRTGGNPLFALSLLGDWVQRELLVPGPTGFLLKEQAQATLPDDLYRVWASRVERLVEAQPADARPALELAAALGQEVDQREWEAACALHMINIPPDLLENLVRTRLAQESPLGWSFTQGMLREALLRGAQEAGRLEGHHAACARMLEGQAPSRGRVERLGRHLVAASRWAEALGPLLQGARESARGDAWEAAEGLLQLHARASDALGLGEGDPNRVQRLELLLEVAQRQRALEVVSALGAQLEALGRRRGDQGLLGRARWAAGWVAYQRHELEEARRAYLEARGLLSRQGDAVGCARCNLGLGDVSYDAPDLEEARQLYAQALAVLEREGPAELLARALQSLGYVQAQRGELEQAHDLHQRALELLQAHGSPVELASAHNALAELDRHSGRLREAEQGYRRALSLLRAVGSANLAVVELNLSLALLLAGRAQEAAAYWEQVRQRPALSGRTKLVVDALELVFAAQRGALGRARELRERFGEPQEVLEHGDLAVLWELAASQLASQAPEEARSLYLLARAQWLKLERYEELRATEARLAALGAAP